MMLGLIALLVCASVVLVVAGLPHDPAKMAIQQRLYTEIASETAAARAQRGSRRWVAALERLNRRLKLDQYLQPGEDETILSAIRLTPQEFLVIREMAAACAVSLYAFFKGFHALQPVWVLIWATVGFLIPSVWLRQQTAIHHRSVARDLPDIADLLALCVEAGSDVMGAIQRIVNEYRPCAFRDELALLLREVSLGVRRREAFRSLARRLNVPEAMAFSRAIVQADRMGTGMVEALQVLSEDLRLRQQHHAERFAQRAPLKMILPLMMMLAAVMCVVAAPVLLQFIRGDLMPKGVY